MIEHILKFIEQRNANTKVNISKTDIENCIGWLYDEETGTIHNKNNTFFSISGFKYIDNKSMVEQPILLQKEIGYLGLLAKVIDGEFWFLMQAKIEPGNINHIQISPTIQATKSNFTATHGGKVPAYLEYFLNAKPENILYDQIQSEQSSRFLGKRNRNIIVLLEAEQEVEVLPTHMWMKMAEIKQLMRYDNLVNMDTRTVLSGIPYSLKKDLPAQKISQAIYRSATKEPNMQTVVDIYRYINDYKMFSNWTIELVPLYSLKNWHMKNSEFVHKQGYPFKIVFCDIAIEGREVAHWHQPLFEAVGTALFGLFCKEEEGIMKFLVKLKPEIGCFDGIEIGPTVQREAGSNKEENEIEHLFAEKLKNKESVLFDTVLSEEGGRFYHEQNQNVIIELQKGELKNPPKGYVWSDFATLNMLGQVNNCLNIQLRNLLSVLEV